MNAYLPVLAYLFFVVFYIYRETRLRIGKDSKKFSGGAQDKGSSILGGAFMVTLFTIPPVLYLLGAGNNSIPVVVQGVGLALMVVGIVIHVRSMKTLGRYFSRTLLVQKRQEIITDGLYKHIRHPGYLGAILLELGLGVASGNLYIAGIIALAIVIFYAYRIHTEEAMLLEAFGAKYQAYKKTSWRLLPHVF